MMMGDPVTVSTGGFRWQVAPEWRDLLLGPAGLRLDEWLRTGAARVLKHGPHRTVYRLSLPGLEGYLKHNRLMNARAWLRELVRPPKARIEYHHARAVAARGIPTVDFLAVGSRARLAGPGESFLISRALDGAVPLDRFLEETLPEWGPREQTQFRQRLAVELGAFVARMHHSGVIHDDLHPANLLIRIDNDAVALFLIDLHAVRLGPAPAWRASRANLVLLNRWFILRANRADRLRFWHSYLQCRWPDAPAHVGGERACELEKQTWASNLTIWRRRDAKAVTGRHNYRRLRSAAAEGFGVAELDQPVLDRFLDDPDFPFRQPGVRLLKDSRSSTVAELEISVGGSPRSVIYKRFRVTAPSDPWIALVRRSPALRSWIAGHGLRNRGLHTPRPLLVLQRRSCGLCHEGYLLTERVDGAMDLHAVLAHLLALPDAHGRSELRGRIDQVARLVRELHRRRLGHRDMKASNILVKDASPAEPPGSAGKFGPLWLIDLVGVTRHRKLSRTRRVQNLARIHASFCRHPALSRCDKLRFLRTYLQWGLHGRAGWKRWWQQIEEATLTKIARNARSGRPLS